MGSRRLWVGGLLFAAYVAACAESDSDVFTTFRGDAAVGDGNASGSKPGDPVQDASFGGGSGGAAGSSGGAIGGGSGGSSASGGGGGSGSTPTGGGAGGTGAIGGTGGAVGGGGAPGGGGLGGLGGGGSGGTGATTSGTGNCCSIHITPGCTNPTISSCVCAKDPYCCNTEWDDICVGKVNQGCGSCPVTTGNCCYAHPGPGCTNSSITSCVCYWDDYCCLEEWDAQCASEVVSEGCGAC